MTLVSGKQSLGQRDTQEDAYRIVRQSEQDPNSDVLILLADGMGGHAGGEVASNLALEAFEHHFSNVSQNPKPRQRLKEALLAANAAVAKRVQDEPGLKGMGCTLIAALKLGDRLVWASVGDSILFLYRNGSLQRLNVDHSLYGELLEMVKAGKITQAEADSHPRRNALRSAIMGEQVSLMDINWTELQPGDVILLASDGVETLSDKEIAGIIGADAKADVRAVSSDLLNAVEQKERPKQDNTTVALYRHQQEGMSGFYRDSRWKLGASEPAASSSGVAKPMLIGAATAVAVMALAALVWKVGFSSAPEEDAPVVETPPLDLAPIDRSEGGINEGDIPENTVPDTGENNPSDGVDDGSGSELPDEPPNTNGEGAPDQSNVPEDTDQGSNTPSDTPETDGVDPAEGSDVPLDDGTPPAEDDPNKIDPPDDASPTTQ